ncbi:MAG: hypothetical protein F4087_11990 [Gemmatimonadetes bacterium]|nr:hypothetical protein [Gemmatimonadota bacterium]MYE68665.1 hypothetical protein [Gemmatimonadota bacterium]MYJ69214.1 hypothetical protein [Gemmatimonadota bacterium]
MTGAGTAGQIGHMTESGTATSGQIVTGTGSGTGHVGHTGQSIGFVTAATTGHVGHTGQTTESGVGTAMMIGAGGAGMSGTAFPIIGKMTTAIRMKAPRADANRSSAAIPNGLGALLLFFMACGPLRLGGRGSGVRQAGQPAKARAVNKCCQSGTGPQRDTDPPGEHGPDIVEFR